MNARAAGPPTALLAGVFALGAAWAQDPSPVPQDHARAMAEGLDLFKRDVRGVLIRSCVPCHGGDEVKGDLDLTTREGLLRGGFSGPAVVPGDRSESWLYLVVSHEEEPTMPDDGDKLPDDEIAAIAEWIELGAPYDRPLVEGSATRSDEIGPITDVHRDYWAFRPLARVEPPDVRSEALVRNPIDRFWLAGLEEAGLEPNAEADRRTLARRLSYDMIGLPPDPDAVDAFVADDSPGAYERWVDRLLGSPHFGERWARHWLDVARFAESHGYEHDYDRPNAYHYRDFVVRALNEDMPFDRFVRWQLAGDELAPEEPMAWMATGFLAAGTHATQITKSQVEKERYDELDDMLGTVGKAMLGLTIGCARCHDHKYDPIPTADYYRMLATFTTTVRSDLDVDMDPEGYRVARAAFDGAHARLVEARESYEREIDPGLARWLRDEPWEEESPDWVVLDFESAVSEGGSTLERLPDGSLLASGENPDFDTYVFESHIEVVGIRSLRLEALAHPSLVRGGPGRASNGNIALSGMTLTAAPLDGSVAPVEVTLLDPRATFEQKGLPVAATIDDDARSAWAVDPKFGEDHAAVFDLAQPVGFEGGTRLVLRLEFRNNGKHNIGRPRVSISTREVADWRGEEWPQVVARAAAAKRAGRSIRGEVGLLDWYRRRDPVWRELDGVVRDHAASQPEPRLQKVLVSSEGVDAVRLHTQGGDYFEETYFLSRGDTNQKLGVASQGFLQVLTRGPFERWIESPPEDATTSWRRRSFADWITDPEAGAGHLLARVIVNRLWQHHMGRGLVATPNDFGAQGESPTHPALLDWLALELIRGGWRLRPIHRLIVTSRAYRLRSGHDAASAAVDRDNRLVWRRPLRRLEGEVVRDSLLAVSGRLDRTMFGPGTLDPTHRRRSLYFTVKRSRPVAMLAAFDAPDGLTSIGARSTTTVAPQALYLMNGAQVREAALAFADRMRAAGERDAAVTEGYRLALARPPTRRESELAVEFVRAQEASYVASGAQDAGREALADFGQALFGANEFIYVD